MSHNRIDITDVHRDQDLVQPYAVEDSNGTAVDLTGASVTWYAAASPTDHPRTQPDDRLLEKTDGGDVTITAAASGELEVRIDTGDWSSLPAATSYYELWITDSSGDESMAAHGRLAADKPAP